LSHRLAIINTDELSLYFLLSLHLTKLLLRSFLNRFSFSTFHRLHTPVIAMTDIDLNRGPSLAKVIDKDVEVCSHLLTLPLFSIFR
jgi:hypothetical protein